MEDKQWWYFTFGSGQKHAGHYVRFFETFHTARDKMFEKYGKEWAFQYSEQQWAEWVQKCIDEHMLWMLETELKLS